MEKIKKFYNDNIKRDNDNVKKEEVAAPSQQPVHHCDVKRKTEKVQLCDPIELIQELNEGNVVHVGDTGYTLKLVDGFVVRYKGDDVVSINGSILTSESYYVYKVIPLDLKIGGRYKTADGRIATIYGKFDDVFHGVFDNSGEVDHFDEHGVATGDGNNLIEEV